MYATAQDAVPAAVLRRRHQDAESAHLLAGDAPSRRICGSAPTMPAHDRPGGDAERLQ